MIAEHPFLTVLRGRRYSRFIMGGVVSELKGGEDRTLRDASTRLSRRAGISARLASYSLVLSAICVGFLLAALGGCKSKNESWPKPPPGKPENVARVIFILLDAARADRFGTYGYKKNTTPEMDEIAREGTVFLNHYSQSNATSASLPQMMTGKYFSQAVIAPISMYPNHRINYDFIAEDPTRILFPDLLLKKTGWRTIGFSAHTSITKDCDLGRSFNELYLIKDKKAAYPNAGRVIPEVQKWIIKNRDEHFFIYIHLLDTHFPHKLKEEHKEFIDQNYNWHERFDKFGGVRKRLKKNPWSNGSQVGDIRDPKFFEHLNALYDGDLKHADKWVGKLWETIGELGIKENTLFVITADHGEELGEHGWYSHVGMGPWDSIFCVPMIMVWPGKIPASRRVSGFTEHVDIAPTLIDLLGVPLPEGKLFDGKSMVPLIINQDVKIRDFACGAFGGYRYIRTERWMAGVFGANNKYLYDVKQDPAEIRNIAAEKPEILSELMKEVDGETGESYRRWMTLSFTKPESTFEVSAEDMALNREVLELEGDELTKIPAGQWAKKARYFIGHGGNASLTPLIFTTSIPSGAYTADLECIHSFGFISGRASVFFAALGDEAMKEYNTTDFVSSKARYILNISRSNNHSWLTAYVPLGIAEAAKNELKISINLPSKPSDWVIFKSIRLTPLGKKRTELSAEEKKKLKALGYLH